MPSRAKSSQDKSGTQGVFTMRDFPTKFRLILRHMGQVREQRIADVVCDLVLEHINNNPDDPAVKDVKKLYFEEDT